MPEKPIPDSTENGSFEEQEDTLSEKGSMRRTILKSMLALGIISPFAKQGESKEKDKSILSEGLEIKSANDLELLLESILPAVYEDFASQDQATERIRQQSGNLKAKAKPVNGETFLASIEDLAERIEQMIQPRGVMEAMDIKFDNRLEQAMQQYLANPASKEAVQEWIRANQLIDLFAAKPVTYRINSFWERINEFDQSVGKQSNRVPVTPTEQSVRTGDRKTVEYLINIIKGYEAVQEYIRNYHNNDPITNGDRAFRLGADVGKPFLFDHKVGSMVSLRD